jgi:hypothetical protein
MLNKPGTERQIPHCHSSVELIKMDLIEIIVEESLEWEGGAHLVVWFLNTLFMELLYGGLCFGVGG